MMTMQEVDRMEEKLIEELGTEELLNALLRAMSYDEKSDHFEFLVRMYEIEADE